MADDASSHPDVLNATAQGQLKSIIERVERLEQERAEIAEQVKEVFAEAKGNEKLASFADALEKAKGQLEEAGATVELK